MALQAVVSCTGSPVRCSIQAATFGAVHSPPSGAEERKAASSSAATASTRGRGPGLVFTPLVGHGLGAALVVALG